MHRSHLYLWLLHGVDLSMSALFTPEIGQAFTDGQTRYVTVSSAQDVANLFGSASSVYKAAQALFSVRPKPNKAIVARWAKEKAGHSGSGVCTQRWHDFGWHRHLQTHHRWRTLSDG